MCIYVHYNYIPCIHLIIVLQHVQCKYLYIYVYIHVHTSQLMITTSQKGGLSTSKSMSTMVLQGLHKCMRTNLGLQNAIQGIAMQSVYPSFATTKSMGDLNPHTLCLTFTYVYIHVYTCMYIYTCTSNTCLSDIHAYKYRLCTLSFVCNIRMY